MSFYTEETGYKKTALSDLQGAWENLLEEVAQTGPFPESDRLLFHIHEAMSWESVRNLEHMGKVLLVIQNIATQAEVPEGVIEWVRMVRESYEEVIEALKEGEIG
jgi:hypothetical protein